jgi:hypothetical protein
MINMMHTPKETILDFSIKDIEQDVPPHVDGKNRRQLIDHLLDEMNSDTMAKLLALSKLKILCPKRK